MPAAAANGGHQRRAGNPCPQAADYALPGPGWAAQRRPGRPLARVAWPVSPA